jgi:hypothetical protein
MPSSIALMRDFNEADLEYQGDQDGNRLLQMLRGGKKVKSE